MDSQLLKKLFNLTSLKFCKQILSTAHFEFRFDIVKSDKSAKNWMFFIVHYWWVHFQSNELFSGSESNTFHNTEYTINNIRGKYCFIWLITFFTCWRWWIPGTISLTRTRDTSIQYIPRNTWEGNICANIVVFRSDWWFSGIYWTIYWCWISTVS